MCALILSCSRALIRGSETTARYLESSQTAIRRFFTKSPKVSSGPENTLMYSTDWNLQKHNSSQREDIPFLRLDTLSPGPHLLYIHLFVAKRHMLAIPATLPLMCYIVTARTPRHQRLTTHGRRQFQVGCSSKTWETVALLMTWAKFGWGTFSLSSSP